MKGFSAVLAHLLLISAMAGPIEDLKPNEWYEIPDSKMSSVDPCPAHNCSYSGSTAQWSVMGAWCSGAFDSKRDRLICWGGGHTNYGGNELYAFDLNTLKWSRLTNPSDPPAFDTAYGSDGLPASRHTYNYLQYVPAIDRFCTFGGAGFYKAGTGYTRMVDCFNFDSNTWERRKEMPAAGNTIGSITAVNPITGHVWYHGTETYSKLIEWDPLTDTWTVRINQENSSWFSYNHTATIDSRRSKMVAIGGGFMGEWDIGGTGALNTVKTVRSTGDTAVVAMLNPGLEYDPVSDKVVAWNGGSDVYLLDMDTKIWTKQVGTGAQPGPFTGYGTFGRFRYVPAKNVFVAVNSNTENVFIYRLTAGTGIEKKTAVYSGSVMGFTASPNPVTGWTKVKFGLPVTDGNGRFEIFDASGARVADLTHALNRGTSELSWNASRVPAGAYVARLTSNQGVWNEALLVLK